MPENIAPLSLQDAAIQMERAAPAPGRLDQKGFRVDDDDDTPSPASAKDDTPSPASAEDVGSRETSTTDQDSDDIADDADDSDSADAQTIDPPKSFTSDEQAEFRELPRGVQETLVRRESERDKAFLTKMNQVAVEKQTISQVNAAAAQLQQNYAQTLEQLIGLTLPELREYENTNWVQLARENPQEAVIRREAANGLSQRLQFMQQQMAQAQQAQQAQHQQVYANYVSDQVEKLKTEAPEFRDAGKTKQIIDDIASTIGHFGFSPQDLGSISDARVVLVLSEFARLFKAEQSRGAIAQKRTASPAPRTMTPGAAHDRTQNKNVVRKAAMDKLSKTGDIWDAVKLMNLN